MSTLREALDKLEEAKEMLSKAIQNSLKPQSILSGKCVIQVKNEREFKLLMEHMDSKKWVWNGGSKPTSYQPSRDYPFSIWYENEFVWDDSEELDERKIISFADFASEIGIKVPAFIMKSEDGVDLYEGDEPCWVLNPSEGKYEIQERLSKCILCKENKCMVSHYIMFSTKEAAEEWISEANKPKEIELINLVNKGFKVSVRDGVFIFNKGFDEERISIEEVERWIEACRLTVPSTSTLREDAK